jgi:predicted RNA-binding protein with RPS1 domain
VKRQNLSGEFQRTAEKIRHHTTNPTADSAVRILSAVDTQSRLALSLERLEAQPSEAGKRREGYRSPMRHAVNRIRAKTPGCDLAALLNIFQDDADDKGTDLLKDLRGAITDPIKVTIQEVDRQKQRVYYRHSGGEQKITFKTLNNYLSLPD